MSEGSKGKQTFGGCLVLIVLAFLVVGCMHLVFSGHSDSTPRSAAAAQPETPPQDVTSNELFSAYQENEVSADQQYKGQRLRVRGRVDSISKDFTDNIYLVLSTPNMFQGVHASLNKEDENRAAALHKGQLVTLICKGNGMIVGSPMLGDCTFAAK